MISWFVVLDLSLVSSLVVESAVNAELVVVVMVVVVMMVVMVVVVVVVVVVTVVNAMKAVKAVKMVDALASLAYIFSDDFDRLVFDADVYACLLGYSGLSADFCCWLILPHGRFLPLTSFLIFPLSYSDQYFKMELLLVLKDHVEILQFIRLLFFLKQYSQFVFKANSLIGLKSVSVYHLGVYS